MPVAPVNGALGSYLHTQVGATVQFWCNEGFLLLTAANPWWTPLPIEHNCTGEPTCGIGLHYGASSYLYEGVKLGFCWQGNLKKKAGGGGHAATIFFVCMIVCVCVGGGGGGGGWQ